MMLLVMQFYPSFCYFLLGLNRTNTRKENLFIIFDNTEKDKRKIMTKVQWWAYQSVIELF
jgi:hypothetical protein